MTELIQPDRHAKLDNLRALGIDPFPARGIEGTPVAYLAVGGGTVEEPGPLIGTRVTVAGRMLSQRDFGKLIFSPVQDRTGQIQVGLQKGRLEDWWELRKNFEPGDLVGVTGELGGATSEAAAMPATAPAPAPSPVPAPTRPPSRRRLASRASRSSTCPTSVLSWV